MNLTLLESLIQSHASVGGGTLLEISAGLLDRAVLKAEQLAATGAKGSPIRNAKGFQARLFKHAAAAKRGEPLKKTIFRKAKDTHNTLEDSRRMLTFANRQERGAAKALKHAKLGVGGIALSSLLGLGVAGHKLVKHLSKAKAIPAVVHAAAPIAHAAPKASMLSKLKPKHLALGGAALLTAAALRRRRHKESATTQAEEEGVIKPFLRRLTPPPWADDVYLGAREWYRKWGKKIQPTQVRQDEEIQEAAVYAVNKLLRENRV